MAQDQAHCRIAQAVFAGSFGHHHRRRPVGRDDRRAACGGGKDVWRFGGESVIQSLRQVGLVDTVEAAPMPVLPGGGGAIVAAPDDSVGGETTAKRT